MNKSCQFNYEQIGRTAEDYKPALGIRIVKIPLDIDIVELKKPALEGAKFKKTLQEHFQ
ncbi:hypothetical protein [Allomuricauda sp. F6463D]|uniref:hypothetical protein n=1 Tax=Allomuricauda sp. F6463D TaxID=2926409 RepID=UPI001FF59950|nr:hypothetical protein [Muricauda sp. F6463D]MCK0161339.1 hypothetical protein [Muricauda sp. F6463D]